MQKVGRSPSRLSRELSRNAQGGEYASWGVRQACEQLRCRARVKSELDPDETRVALGIAMLGWFWSPQQIARILSSMWRQP